MSNGCEWSMHQSVGGGILQRPLTRLLAEDVDLRLDTSRYRLLISLNVGRERGS